jgi:hypothetical protein
MTVTNTQPGKRKRNCNSHLALALTLQSQAAAIRYLCRRIVQSELQCSCRLMALSAYSQWT